jgi:hypothetical protein
VRLPLEDCCRRDRRLVPEFAADTNPTTLHSRMVP